jgi:hypothetical protein
MKSGTRNLLWISARLRACIGSRDGGDRMGCRLELAETLRALRLANPHRMIRRAHGRGDALYGIM